MSFCLARFPNLVTALFALLPGYQRYTGHLASQYTGAISDVPLQSSDPIFFGVTVLMTVLMTIWMVALVYRSYSVTCNVAGGKAIGVFIAILILAELISKVVLSTVIA